MWRFVINAVHSEKYNRYVWNAERSSVALVPEVLIDVKSAGGRRGEERRLALLRSNPLFFIEECNKMIIRFV